MKFLVCRKQWGTGCNYMIGCGMTFEYVEAKSIEDAIEKTLFPDGREYTGYIDGDDRLSEMLVVPKDKVFTVDLDSLRKQSEEARKNELYEQKERKERADFERLSKKYGKN